MRMQPSSEPARREHRVRAWQPSSLLSSPALGGTCLGPCWGASPLSVGTEVSCFLLILASFPWNPSSSATVLRYVCTAGSAVLLHLGGTWGELRLGLPH